MLSSLRSLFCLACCLSACRLFARLSVRILFVVFVSDSMIICPLVYRHAIHHRIFPPRYLLRLFSTLQSAVTPVPGNVATIQTWRWHLRKSCMPSTSARCSSVVRILSSDDWVAPAMAVGLSVTQEAQGPASACWVALATTSLLTNATYNDKGRQSVLENHSLPPTKRTEDRASWKFLVCHLQREQKAERPGNS